MNKKTAFQKIVDTHLLETLPDGRLVLKLDKVFCHEITTPNAIIDMQQRGTDVVFNPNRVKAMIDHVSPAKDTLSAVQGKIMRDWCKGHIIEFLDVGRNGVCHAIIPEKGWILPGEIAIMGDSHTCTHGACAAFTAGVGTTDLETGIMTGLWVCPPQKVIRVNFVGTLPANVFSKDLILTLIGQIGVKGATNAVLEFGGPVIENLSMEARMTITNMAVEAGATSGMMPIDETLIDYILPALGELYSNDLNVHQFVTDLNEKFGSDEDCEYAQVIEIDVTDMKPVLTQNYSPGDVMPFGLLYGKKVDQIYIGSCTNGRIEDLRIAAKVFKAIGKPVAEGVRCIINPATPEVWRMAEKEGLFITFQRAGCCITNPSCGACLGMSCGVLAPGEVCVSTTNRNFPGRMESGGMVHLASPAVAAATAMEGFICAPSGDIFGAMNDSRSKVHPSSREEIQVAPINYAELAAKQVGERKDFSGTAFYLLESNIDTDQIIPAKYLTEVDKVEMGKHCLEDAPISTDDRPKLFASQILVAGDNFGCGSSREHAPWALEAAGIRCIIAPSFARIFQENMFANGLLCLTADADLMGELERQKPDQIMLGFDQEEGENTLALIFPTTPHGNICRNVSITSYQKNLIENGGSVGVMLKLAAQLQAEGKI